MARISLVVNVGVVISVYGRYSFVSEAIESVLKQSMRPREVVVVADDPDKVPYRDKIYVVEAKDRKYGSAILRGVDATASDAIAFLDDDDKFHPDKLSIVTKILKKYPEVMTIHNMQAFMDVNGNPIGDDDPRVRIYIEKQPGFALLLNRYNAWKWYKEYPMIHHNNSSMTVRRSVFERHRPIFSDMELMFDFTLLALSINDGYYLHTPERLTIYRIGSGHTTMGIQSNLTRVKRRLCIQVRHWHDIYLLYQYIRNIHVRNILNKILIKDISTYWLRIIFSSTTLTYLSKMLLKVIASTLCSQ